MKKIFAFSVLLASVLACGFPAATQQSAVDPTKIALEYQATAASLQLTQAASAAGQAPAVDPTKIALEYQATAASLQLTQAASAAGQAPAVNPPVYVAPTTAIPPQPISPSITWTIDNAGVCRNNKGGYPRWTDYSWTLSQCQEACQNNPNCQGFAMSKQKDYCQLFGSDGANEAGQPDAQITRGDQAHPDYTCYLKSNDQSILAWTMDSIGVCRDGAGGYPRWSEYNWSLSQCQNACKDNPNCQGLAMSKEKNYCQLFGSDGQYDGSGSSTQITKGDSSYPKYTCFIKR